MVMAMMAREWRGVLVTMAAVAALAL